MNTKSAWQVWSSLVLCIGSSGCAEHITTNTQPPQRDACADYGGLTAVLAEATINCTGTIGPQSFLINQEGLLQQTFTSCTAGPDRDRAQNFAKVSKLIRLQSFRSALPRFQECLTDRYVRWSELFKRTNLKTCPVWTDPTVIAEGNLASSTQLSKMQPQLPYVPGNQKQSDAPGNQKQSDAGIKPAPDQRFVDIQAPSKSSILYKISYPQPEPACADAAVCAAQCAAFLPGFVVSAAGDQLLADPASWYRDRATQPCTAPGTDDPWCPPYVHAMAITRTSAGSTVPPGDLYGHPNRGNMGERCVRWAPPTATTPGANYITDLVLECTDAAQTDCLSRCGN